MKHNNQLPNQHFRKGWERYVRTWFDQPGRKHARRAARRSKAALMAPRPVDGLLRPAVRGQTIKYNTKVRAGRGFTLEELKEAGIARKTARSIGIAVDHRRKNRSAEGLAGNVARLRAYRERLVVLPSKRALKGGAVVPAFPAQLGKGALLPITAPAAKVEFRVLGADAGKLGAFRKLRLAASNARYAGIRAARAKAAEEEEKAKSK